MSDRAPVILFDGDCNLCNGAVQFVLARERRPYLHFASLQSPAGRALLESHGLPPERFDSFVLIESGRVYTRSDAALRVVRRLRGLWPLLVVLRIIPRILRDAIYDFIGARRYRWFGRADACWASTPERRARFLNGN